MLHNFASGEEKIWLGNNTSFYQQTIIEKNEH